MSLEFNRMLKKKLRVAGFGLRVMNHKNAKIAQIVKSLRTVTPAEAGVQIFDFLWIPAYAGMTRI
jgi:hypothetical protein